MGKFVKRNLGFTLIELMAVVAVVAILAAIALPSFIAQIRHSRRSEVQGAIQSAALAEERVRADCTTYVSVSGAAGWTTAPAGCGATLGGNPYTSTYYTLAISNSSGTTYTITASAVGSQTNDSAFGTPCSALTYRYASGAIDKAPTACWSQ
jgi:type IV pilus assembly protein PilE